MAESIYSPNFFLPTMASFDSAIHQTLTMPTILAIWYIIITRNLKLIIEAEMVAKD